MLHSLKRLWDHLNKRRQIQLLSLLFLMLLASFSEMLSIGAVVPFLAVLTAPDKIFQIEILAPAINFLNIDDPSQLALPITVLFASLSLFAGIVRVVLIFVSTRISYAVGSDLSLNMFRKTLHQPYLVHLSRNSSSIVNILSTKLDTVVGAIILNGLTFISNIVMIIAILCVLFYINFPITLITFISLGAVYFITIKIIRDRVLNNGYQISSDSTHLVKLIQEAMGSIRDLLIHGYQETYCRHYKETDQSMRKAQAINHSIVNSPRFIMESFALLFISILAYILVNQEQGILRAIPIMGTIALGAQRLLPMMQQAYSMWVGIIAAQGPLDEVLVLLQQKEKHNQLPNHGKISFKDSIELKNISFSYQEDREAIFKKINLTIKKGSRIGIIGKTGSGKTTLVDIILGLLHPSEGHMLVDGKKMTPLNIRTWQKNIAHVPQSIFLIDATIAENIAFGIPSSEINYDRLNEVCNLAQLNDFVSKLLSGLNTKVGERGVQLSGGQRQRIGIARALYRQSDIIIFDEATSALDNETERAIIDTINHLSKDITILIIAHRVSTLKNCEKVIEIKDKRLSFVGVK